MNLPRMTSSNFVTRLPRQKLLLILETACSVRSLRFLRQTALAWLTQYPGDMGVNLLLARGLLAEGKPLQAIPILQKLCRLDPENEDALAALAQASQELDPGAANKALAGHQVISKGAPLDVQMPAWVRLLRSARTALQEGRLEDAEKMAAQVLENEQDNLLAAILQVQLAAARKDYASVLAQSQKYSARWPDCLQFSLLNAEAMLATGDEVAAVNLLHRCVVNDPAGQVPARLWGLDFPYSPIWPDPLEISYDIPIPADVSARLGWNLLPTARPAAFDAQDIRVVETPTLQDENIAAVPFSQPHNLPEIPIEDEPVFPFIEVLLRRQEEDLPELEPEEEPEPAGIELSAGGGLPAEQTGDSIQPAALVSEAKTLGDDHAESFKSVHDEFERIAKRLKRPSIARADGRFPLYVLFTTQSGLSKQYGSKTVDVVDRELNLLAEQLRKRPGWGALVYYADSPACASKLGLQAVSHTDPWKLKLALADLDAALARQGEMIGALLIVGGPEVVPHHMLPNPTDDMDDDIASDNPYATRDSNYFIPEWPVGRLPGETGSEPGLLLDQIRRVTRYHTRGKASARAEAAGMLSLLEKIQAFWRERTERKKTIGYTAAVWRRSSVAAFRPIGVGKSLLASPPQSSGNIRIHKKRGLSLAYYNLHGLVDAAEWYGQRDVAAGEGGPDYPVALSPRDISAKDCAPSIIFSEACYGGHITGKAEDQSMALKFLSHGSLAMIASSSASYGSVTEPLIAADLLSFFFWKNLRSGRPAGDAFIQAKIDFVREMKQRQGFLDGEDQKTLISFIFYGDPLAHAAQYGSQVKGFLRNKIRPALKTISDQKPEKEEPCPVTGPTLMQVKQIVSQYLPGMEQGEMSLCAQTITSAGKAEAKETEAASDRVVVSIRREVRLGLHTHHTCARLTMDKRGKMVKLALTR